MENLFGGITYVIFVFISVLIFYGIIMKVIKDRCFSERTVPAIVVDKKEFQKLIVPKSQATDSAKRYLVVFESNHKLKRFYVSEFSYNNCVMGKKGTLRYQGSSFIYFT